MKSKLSFSTMRVLLHNHCLTDTSGLISFWNKKGVFFKKGKDYKKYQLKIMIQDKGFLSDLRSDYELTSTALNPGDKDVVAYNELFAFLKNVGA